MKAQRALALTTRHPHADLSRIGLLALRAASRRLLGLRPPAGGRALPAAHVREDVAQRVGRDARDAGGVGERGGLRGRELVHLLA
eukprot:scaffold66729_cov63-Phaeocystis_antarctica.AAC.1